MFLGKEPYGKAIVSDSRSVSQVRPGSPYILQLDLVRVAPTMPCHLV